MKMKNPNINQSSSKSSYTENKYSAFIINVKLRILPSVMFLNVLSFILYKDNSCSNMYHVRIRPWRWQKASSTETIYSNFHPKFLVTSIINFCSKTWTEFFPSPPPLWRNFSCCHVLKALQVRHWWEGTDLVFFTTQTWRRTSMLQNLVNYRYFNNTTN